MENMYLKGNIVNVCDCLDVCLFGISVLISWQIYGTHEQFRWLVGFRGFT